MLFVLDNKQFRKTIPLVYLLFLKFPLQAKGGDYSGNLSSITEVTISYVSAADAIKNSLLNVFLQKNSKLSDLSFGALYSSDTSIPGIHNLVPENVHKLYLLSLLIRHLDSGDPCLGPEGVPWIEVSQYIAILRHGYS